MTSSDKPETNSKRFRRREAVLGAAIGLINESGLKGMTLAEVANRLDIVSTGVAYYFRRKEQLASACYLSSIERLNSCITAAQGETVEGRLRSFLAIYFDYLADVATGTALPIVRFDEARTLSDAMVNEAIIETFKNFRKLLRDDYFPLSSQASNARAHLLYSSVFWLPALLERHTDEDYSAIADIVLALWLNGVAARPLPVSPPRIEGRTLQQEDVRSEEFLKAATTLINEHGYAGASVERISATLNVSKGAFYHHNATKDELIVSCFERTLAIARAAKDEASNLPASGLEKLWALSVYLIEHQLSGNAPLLSLSALMTVPKHIQLQLARDFDRISNGFILLFSQGIADRSIKPVSPIVASLMFSSMINAAVDLPMWIPDLTARNIADLFIRPFFEGAVGIAPVASGPSES